ncbi:MAG: hypothetical protein ABI224_15390 [Acetobacteraceae bacterium]
MSERTMRGNAVGVSLIIALAANSALAKPAVAVYVQEPSYPTGASPDITAEQLEYYVKKEISDSGRFSLAYSNDTAEYRITLTFIKDEANSIAYSSVLILAPNIYIDNLVGVCGASAVARCAAQLFSIFANDMDQFR